MIPRNLSRELLILLGEYPVVTLLGPRQAGKTTLVRDILKGYEYVNLEIPNTLQIGNLSFWTVIDPRVPDLISWDRAKTLSSTLVASGR